MAKMAALAVAGVCLITALTSSPVQADNLSEIRIAAFRAANFQTSGVTSCTATEADSMISIECKDFHLSYPKSLIRRDTIYLVAGTLAYDMEDDVFAVDTINPITFCYIWEYRTNKPKKVEYPLFPILSDNWFEVTRIQTNAEEPSSTANPQYVMYSGGQMIVYPTPRYADTLVYDYLAMQQDLLAGEDFDINEAYYGRFVQAVANRILAKVGLPVGGDSD